MSGIFVSSLEARQIKRNPRRTTRRRFFSLPCLNPEEWIMVWIDSSWWGMIEVFTLLHLVFQKLCKRKKTKEKFCVYQHLSMAREREKEKFAQRLYRFSRSFFSLMGWNCRPTSHQHFHLPMLKRGSGDECICETLFLLLLSMLGRKISQ